MHGASCIQRRTQIRPKGGSGGRYQILPLVGSVPFYSFLRIQAALAYSTPSIGPSLLGSMLGYTVAGCRRLPSFPCFPCFPCFPSQPRVLDSLEFPYCFRVRNSSFLSRKELFLTSRGSIQAAPLITLAGKCCFRTLSGKAGKLHVLPQTMSGAA